MVFLLLSPMESMLETSVKRLMRLLCLNTRNKTLLNGVDSRFHRRMNIACEWAFR